MNEQNIRIKHLNTRYYTILICVILIISTISIYWRVGGFGFISLDDPIYITKEIHIQKGITLENIRWAFTAFVASNWHPITLMSHMLDCQLFGLEAGYHHLTNLFFHILNTLLLFFVLRRMTGDLWKSAFVAALFALHPQHVESVAWISERKDVLSTFFGMLTLLCYTRYAEHSSIDWYFLAFIFFILGLMAKPMLVTLPFVFLLCDFWPMERFYSGWRPIEKNGKHTAYGKNFVSRSTLFLILEKLPFFFIVVLACVVTVIAQDSTRAIVNVEHYSVSLRISNALITYMMYLLKTVIPTSLSIYYPVTYHIPFLKTLLASVSIIIISITVFKKIKTAPYLVYGWLWFIGTLIPVIGLIKVGGQCRADRYTYIPLIGIFIMISWGIPSMMNKINSAKKTPIRLGIAVIGTIYLLMLMMISWKQVGYWENSLILFKRAIEVTPNNHVAHRSVAVYLDEQGKLEEAVKYYTRALRIHKDKKTIAHYARACNTIGTRYLNDGNIDDAIKYFSNTIRYEKSNGRAHFNLFMAFKRKGRITEANKHFQRALKLVPENAEKHSSRGQFLKELGHMDDATLHLSEAESLRHLYSNILLLIDRSNLDQ